MMEIRSFVSGFLLCFFILITYSQLSGFGVCDTEQAEAIFSPESEMEIIDLIRSAKESIDLQMYVFTNERLASELSDAVDRGVEVRVILEPRVNSYNLEQIVDALVAGGVRLRWASLDFKLTHSKMMIVDGKKVLVGSINFSKSAVSKNREAAVLIRGDEVSEYISVFEEDWKKASFGR